MEPRPQTSQVLLIGYEIRIKYEIRKYEKL